MSGRRWWAVRRWVLIPGLIVSLTSTALADPDFNRFRGKPYPLVRTQLIKLGYRPLAQAHPAIDMACYVGDANDKCTKWPEILACENESAIDGSCFFIFADRKLRGRGHRRRLVVVQTTGVEQQVYAVRFPNAEDRVEFQMNREHLAAERERGTNR